MSLFVAPCAALAASTAVGSMVRTLFCISIAGIILILWLIMSHVLVSTGEKLVGFVA